MANTSTELCPNCQGSGFQVIQKDGRSYAKPCSCQHVKHKAKQGSDMGIPRRYRHCTTSSFIVENQEAHLLRELCQEFAQTFPAVERGLLFSGPPGTGKTHLATGILRAISERGIFGRFVDLNELYRSLQATYQKGADLGELDILEPLLESPLLVMDDLGARFESAWMQDVVGYILNGRYNRNRPVVITTNLGLLPGQNGPGTGEKRIKPLQEHIGDRAWSRLCEMCRMESFTGKDFRQKA